MNDEELIAALLSDPTIGFHEAVKQAEAERALSSASSSEHQSAEGTPRSRGKSGTSDRPSSHLPSRVRRSRYTQRCV